MYDNGTRLGKRCFQLDASAETSFYPKVKIKNKKRKKRKGKRWYDDNWLPLLEILDLQEKHI